MGTGRSGASLGGMPSPAPPAQRVVIAGGGVAALEAVLALRELAASRVAVTLLTPDAEYVDRPQAVGEPFALAPAAQHDLAEIARELGADLVADRLSWVDPAARAAHTTGGRTLPYDALLVAVGARPVARHPLALTLDPGRMQEQVGRVLEEIEEGTVRSLVLLIPDGMTWPLPAYELALMTAERARQAGRPLRLSVVTPEAVPLEVFGPEAGAGVRELLDEAGIELVTAGRARMASARRVEVGPAGAGLDADRVIALPELHGPAVRGLPGGRHGLIPVDPYCRVRGLDGVFAAGDATDHPVKHGGIAAQQAATAAASIAARAGAPVLPRTLRPVVRAKLLTGRGPRYLSARVAGDYGSASSISATPPWSPPDKVVATHLGPWLASRSAAARERAPATSAGRT